MHSRHQSKGYMQFGVRIVRYACIEHLDIPASYVSLPEGRFLLGIPRNYAELRITLLKQYQLDLKGLLATWATPSMFRPNKILMLRNSLSGEPIKKKRITTKIINEHLDHHSGFVPFAGAGGIPSSYLP